MNERPNQGEQLAGAAGLALILIMLIFAWFGLEGFGSGDAFDTMKDWVNLIAVLAAFGGMSLAIFGSQAARGLPAPLSAITAGLGAVATLLILLHVINPPDDLDRKIGAFLGLIAAALVTVGGYLAMQGERMPSAGSRRTRPPAEPPPASPPPPPPPPPPPGT